MYRKNFPHRKKLRQEQAKLRQEAYDKKKTPLGELKLNERGNYNGEEVINVLLKKERDRLAK